MLKAINIKGSPCAIADGNVRMKLADVNILKLIWHRHWRAKKFQEFEAFKVGYPGG
jgi:hypothetical protein